MDGLGQHEQGAELKAVVREVDAPQVEVEVGHLEGGPAAHLQGLRQLGVIQLLGAERVVVEVGVLLLELLEARHPGLQMLDLPQHAPEGDAEGVDGAFEPLEEADAHHAGQDALAALLGEPADAPLVGVPRVTGQVLAQVLRGPE